MEGIKNKPNVAELFIGTVESTHIQEICTYSGKATTAMTKLAKHFSNCSFSAKSNSSPICWGGDHTVRKCCQTDTSGTSMAWRKGSSRFYPASSGRNKGRNKGKSSTSSEVFLAFLKRQPLVLTEEQKKLTHSLG